MDFKELMSDDFNPWEVPLSPEALEQLARIEEHLTDYRDRLNKQISRMHEARLKARDEADLPKSARYEPRSDPNAACRFESIKVDQILYSGQIWFRNECDGFSSQDCEPLPLALLGASENEIREAFSRDAARERQALDERRQAATEVARKAQEASERADYERLRLKFGR